MKILILALLASFSVFAQVGQSGTSEKYAYEVIALNSPVKDGVARFLLKSLVKSEVIQIKYFVQNPFKIDKLDKNYSSVTLAKKENETEFQLPVNRYPNGFYRLYLQVSTKEQKSIQFRNKYHDFVKFEINKPSKVQMPDPVQNNATLAGIDSDNDGIRDDVQIWINETYSNELERKSMEQAARTLQSALLAVKDKEASLQATRLYLDSLFCMSSIVGIDDKIRKNALLKSKIINTKKRIHAEIEFNHFFSGQESSLPITQDDKRAMCAF